MPLCLLKPLYFNPDPTPTLVAVLSTPVEKVLTVIRIIGIMRIIATENSAELHMDSAYKGSSASPYNSLLRS